MGGAGDSVADMSAHESSPEDTDSPEREKLLGRAILALAAIEAESPDDLSRAINRVVNSSSSIIRAYSDHTLELMCDPKMKRACAEKLLNGIYYPHWNDQQVSDFLSNADLFDSMLNKNQSRQVNLDSLSDRLGILAHYKELAPLGTETRVRQVAAIETFIRHAESAAPPEVLNEMVLRRKGSVRDFSTPYINDPKLRELLTSPDYNQDVVMSIVTQRGIFNAEHILALLESASTPLISGSL